MKYYLSYVEVNGHACLMISESSKGSNPRVTTEIGFAYSPNIADENVGYFSSYKGHVREEQNVSKLCYASMTDFRHRTYQISEAELIKFYKIINDELNINKSLIEISDSDDPIKIHMMVGGANYKKIGFNCKAFALSVMRKVGIIDSEKLCNFAVQRPNTKSSYLEKLDSDDFEYTRKDQFIESFKDFAIKLRTNLHCLNNFKDSLKISELDRNDNMHQLLIAAEHEDSEVQYTNEEYFKSVDFALKLVDALEDKINKADVLPEYEIAFDELNRILTQLTFIKDRANIDFTYDESQNLFDNVIDDLDILVDEDMTDLADALYDLNTKDSDFYWTNMPTVTPRKNLSNLNAEERAMYHAQQEGEIVLETFSALENMLKEELAYGNNKLSENGIEILNHLTRAKIQIQNSLIQFELSHSTNNEIVICNQFRNNLKIHLQDFYSVLEKCECQSDHASKFVRLIDTLLTLLLGESYMLKNRPKDFVQSKIASLTNHTFFREGTADKYQDNSELNEVEHSCKEPKK